MEEMNNFSNCTCDLTLDSCDPFCCCDDDCGDNVKASWKEQRVCSNIAPRDSIKKSESFEECWDKFNVVGLEDIQSGFSILEKRFRTLSCTRAESPANLRYDYIDTL
jgi:hypothetical protein